VVKKLKTNGSIKAIYSFKGELKLKRPVMGPRVPAGFPSPARDYIEGRLDLNERLINHPAATFFIYVDGYSMVGAGIYPDDLLVVDRSLEATNNKIVVAVYDGEMTIKRLRITDEGCFLCAENPDFPDIRVEQELDLIIWGVVTNVIRKV
jgi:DNA polymerase V